MNNLFTQTDSIFESYDSLLKSENAADIIQLDVESIIPFRNHPFKVKNDADMLLLKESIHNQGILHPVIVRKISRTKYEMISGHRRLYAVKELHLPTIPAIIADYSDDDAVIAMVEANLQRTEILPSEKAFAYRMLLDAIKHQGTSRRDVEKSKNSCDEIGEKLGISGRQLQRYIKLTNLDKRLLALVDKKKITIDDANILANLSMDVQDDVFNYLNGDGKMSTELAKALYSAESDGNYSTSIYDAESTPKSNRVRLSFNRKSLESFFPPGTSYSDMEKFIISLLENMKNQ